MSDQSMWNELGNYIPETSGSSKTETTQKKSIWKILKILVCTLAVVLVVQVVAYFVIIPNTTACTVSFSGLQTLDATEIGTGLAQTCGTNWLQFDTSAAASKMLSYSAVESVSVQKRFPNQIVVDVKERVPVAMTLARVNERTMPALIDENGVVFALANEAIANNLPLVTGFELGTFFEGMRLNSKFSPLLKQISEIQKANVNYFQVISEILISPKEYDNYELVIYPVHTKTRVLVDRNFTEDALKYMMVALDVVKSVSPDVSELDLRYGSVSYKIGL